MSVLFHLQPSGGQDPITAPERQFLLRQAAQLESVETNRVQLLETEDIETFLRGADGFTQVGVFAQVGFMAPTNQTIARCRKSAVAMQFRGATVEVTRYEMKPQ